MNKILLILHRKYMQIAKTKLIIISTLLTPIFMIGVFIVPLALARLRTGSPERIAIVDNSGSGIYEEIEKHLGGEDLRPGYEFSRIEMSLYDDIDTTNMLREKILSRELDAYIIIDRDILETGNVAYYARNVANFTAKG